VITHPSVEKVLHGERGILTGINACIDCKCVMSAVTLIYAAIDAMAGLTRPVDEVETNGSHFRDWAQQYFLPFLGRPVTPAELWGARCGVIHAYSPESRVSRKSLGNTVIYKWRLGHRLDDPLLADRAKTSIVLEVEGLVEAFEKAINLFQEQIEAQPELKARVEYHVQGLLCYQPWQPVPIIVAA
jgi:hypothetical protein